MPANIQELLANELTDTQVLIVLIPLALVMLFVGWVEKRAGRPDYKKLINGHKGWALIQMLPPQSCALIMSALPEADAQAYVSAGCTAPAKLLSIAEKLLDEFMASWPEDRKVSSSSSLKEKEAAWAAFAACDTNEAAKLILNVWPPERPAASPASGETAEAADADTVPEASPASSAPAEAEAAANEPRVSAPADSEETAVTPAEASVSAEAEVKPATSGAAETAPSAAAAENEETSLSKPSAEPDEA